AVLQLEEKSAYEIFGSPDDLKLHSCATLFAQIAPPDSVFKQLLDQYFQGKPDVKTLQLLEANNCILDKLLDLGKGANPLHDSFSRES
ncbi:MAG: DUF1810 family protein, partial [Cyanobacteria bacterium J06639_14]